MSATSVFVHTASTLNKNSPLNYCRYFLGIIQTKWYFWDHSISPYMLIWCYVAFSKTVISTLFVRLFFLIEILNYKLYCWMIIHLRQTSRQPGHLAEYSHRLFFAIFLRKHTNYFWIVCMEKWIRERSEIMRFGANMR